MSSWPVWDPPRDGILEGDRHSLRDSFLRFEDKLSAEGYAKLIGRPVGFTEHSRVARLRSQPPFHVPAHGLKDPISAATDINSHPGCLARECPSPNFSVLASECFPLLAGEHSQEKAGLLLALRAVARDTATEGLWQNIRKGLAEAEVSSNVENGPSCSPGSGISSGRAGREGNSRVRCRSASAPRAPQGNSSPGAATPARSTKLHDSPWSASTSTASGDTDGRLSKSSPSKSRTSGRSLSVGSTPSASRRRQADKERQAPGGQAVEWLRQEMWKANRRSGWV